jgi:hypothetical protein
VPNPERVQDFADANGDRDRIGRRRHVKSRDSISG